MNAFLAASILVITLIQSAEPPPRVRRLSVVSKYSTEIVFKYGYRSFVENEPVKQDAVECFISTLKSTGLFTEVSVDLKPIDDGKWLEVDITPSWDYRRKSFVINEIAFDGFDGFDLAALRSALRRAGLHEGISLWKYALWEIGNMVAEQASKIYGSDEGMMGRISSMDVGHPKFYVQVIDSVNVRLTISLLSGYPCTSLR